MKTRTILIIVAIICVLAFIFAAPIRSAEVPDGCLGCVVHFQRSLSCELVPVGDYYWDGSLSFGYHPLSRFVGCDRCPRLS